MLKQQLSLFKHLLDFKNFSGVWQKPIEFYDVSKLKTWDHFKSSWNPYNREKLCLKEKWSVYGKDSGFFLERLKFNYMEFRHAEFKKGDFGVFNQYPRNKFFEFDHS